LIIQCGLQTKWIKNKYQMEAILGLSTQGKSFIAKEPHRLRG
jgi:hypothetical protein